MYKHRRFLIGLAAILLPTFTPAHADHETYHTLRQCEGHVPGESEYHVGYYQFSPDTAAKVGIDGSEDLEEQTAAAKAWASQVDPGSTAGWPNCWPGGAANTRSEATRRAVEPSSAPILAQTPATPTSMKTLAITG